MIVLDAIEARVLGCLLEKQLATPQYYPLTLNSLGAACNQSSNRDPVTAYQEHEVAGALASLREKGLVRVIHSAGNRAAKYRHVLDEMWGLDDAHRAVLAVLMLRGPQTLGELRARTERLATFDRLSDVEEVLGLLGGREEPLVRHLARQPGQKEARFAQLFSPLEPAAPAGYGHEPGGSDRSSEPWRESDAATASLTDGHSAQSGATPSRVENRLADLEATVVVLQAEIAALRTDLGELSELRRLLD